MADSGKSLRRVAEAGLFIQTGVWAIKVARMALEAIGDAQTLAALARHSAEVSHAILSAVGYVFSPIGSGITIVLSGGYLWIDNRRHKRETSVSPSRETTVLQPSVETPQLVTVSPIPDLPAVVTSVESSPRAVQPNEQVYVDLQPHELVAPFQTRLRAQAEQEVARYIGKHYRITGPVTDIHNQPDECVVMLDILPAPTERSVLGTTVLLRFGLNWKAKIDLLNKHDTVSAVGEIEAISWRRIDMKNCAFLV